MKWTCIAVLFEHDQPSLAAEAVAEAFSRAGIGQVEIQDPIFEPVPGAWGTPPSASHAAVRGYVATPDARRTAERLNAELVRLQRHLALAWRIDTRQVDDEDWAHGWKAFFKPTEVGRRLVIKPSWCSWPKTSDRLVVEIDPGMAFGTGTHPTTVLCLELMEDLLEPEADVLDLGTGSGILLVAAALLGAKRLVGVDVDPVAVEAAAFNLRRNGIEPSRWQVLQGDLVQGISGRFDLVVANILAPVLCRLAPAAAGVLRPNGRLVASGIAEGQQREVIEAMAAGGLSLVHQRTCDGWVALVFGSG